MHACMQSRVDRLSLLTDKWIHLQDIPLTQVLREQADIPAEQLRVPGA